MLLTEYYVVFNKAVPKAGMMRVKLRPDYSESVDVAEEIVFSGFNLVFTSAYYPSPTTAYAMAFDLTNSMNYLLQYEWDDPNKAPRLWPMPGFGEDPNSQSFKSFWGSVIYAENPNTGDDFPVKGFLVGSTRSIWGYNGCNAPDFGISFSYDNLFSSSALYGFVSKIELDDKSCKNEIVAPIVDIIGSDGPGRGPYFDPIYLGSWGV